MDLLVTYIEERTKFNLSEAQKQAIKALQEGVSFEILKFYTPHVSKDVRYWHLDLFSNLIEEFNKLEAKKEKIISDLGHQSIEDSELVEKIKSCLDGAELEDLYRPYKRRKKTKATVAREAGLNDLTDWIWKMASGEEKSDLSLEVKAKEYIKPQLGFVTYEVVLKGAQDIIVERLLKNSDLRKALRKCYYSQGVVSVSKTEKFKEGKYSHVANFREKVSDLLNSKNYYKFPNVKKAWEEGFLKVLVEAKIADLLSEQKKSVFKFEQENDHTKFLTQAFDKAIEIHILPSITQEIIDDLLKVSETETIKRLKQDYNKLLMLPAFGAQPVLSCIQYSEEKMEIALVTHSGDLVSATQIKPNEENSKGVLADVLKDINSKISLGAIAIGQNENAKRAQTFLSEVLKTQELKTPIAIVDMRGTSAYVNCDDAKAEFGERPKTERALVSLARRLQDPLKELSKYPAKSLLDVPFYVNEERLLPELTKVLKFCSANVGVDLNAAPRSLLLSVDGMDEALVDKILEFRKAQGRFVEKMQLKSDLSFSDEVLLKCSGFFKVNLSKSILDRTCIRVHRFAAVRDMLKDLDISLSQAISEADGAKILNSKYKDVFSDCELNFVVRQLQSPGRDPRRPYKFFKFKPDIEKLADVKVGEVYPALVSRFSSFGAFVDIGVGQDGLIHLSELSNSFVADPRSIISLGEWINVKAIDINLDKKLLSLSKIKAEKTQGARGHDKTQRDGTKKKNFSKGKKPKSKSSGKRPGNKGGKPRKPKTPFNNPFAALGDLNLKD